MSKRIITCSMCGKSKRHEAFGLCKLCYDKSRQVQCIKCGRSGRPAGKDVCHKCYISSPEQKLKRAVRVKANGHKRKIIKCWWCWSEHKHAAFGVCKRCYEVYTPTVRLKKRQNANTPENKEKIKARNANYYANLSVEGKELRKEQNRLKYNTDPARKATVLASVGVRRARKANVPGKHTKAEWAARVEEFKNRCAFCDVELTNSKGPTKRTKEHLVPILYGSNSSHAISNIVPACSKCNSSKGDKLPLEYIWSII